MAIQNKLSNMKKSFLIYLYPLIGVVALAILMLRPNYFNLIPYTIYYAFGVSSMPEYEFIVWFDIIFLGIMYWLMLRVTRRFILSRQSKKSKENQP